MELREAKIRSRDLDVEKPTLKEIRGNPVWLRLKRRNKEAETGRSEEKEERKEAEQLELYPKRGLMVIHSEKCSDKASESNKEKILMLQSEVFKDFLEVNTQ